MSKPRLRLMIDGRVYVWRFDGWLYAGTIGSHALLANLLQK